MALKIAAVSSLISQTGFLISAVITGQGIVHMASINNCDWLILRSLREPGFFITISGCHFRAEVASCGPLAVRQKMTSLTLSILGNVARGKKVSDRVISLLNHTFYIFLEYYNQPSKAIVM